MVSGRVRQMGGWCWWDKQPSGITEWISSSPNKTRAVGVRASVDLCVCFWVIRAGNCHKVFNSCFDLVYLLKCILEISCFKVAQSGLSWSLASILSPDVEKIGKCVGTREARRCFQSTAEVQTSPLMVDGGQAFLCWPLYCVINLF